MQTQLKHVVTTLSVPLVLCLGCPLPDDVPDGGTPGTMPGVTTVDEEMPVPTTGMLPGTTDIAGTTGPTEATGTTSATDDTGDTSGPREPIANSVLATFVDEQGNPLPGAWVRVLATPVDPGNPPSGDPPPGDPPPEDPPPKPLPGARSMDLPLPKTADSGGSVLVEALGTGEQRWMIGAPGFVTRTEVFTLPAGTRTHNTFRLKRKGQTFKFDTAVAQSFEHENVRVELPAGHLVNRRTGEQVTGEISVNITVVNPIAGSKDAAPVPLIGVDVDGGSGSLASFGMVGVDLVDAEGERLELNEEVAAKVSFKLTKEQSDQVDLLGAKVIPAWHADPDAGDTEWSEIGVFFLSAKDDQGCYTVTTHAVRRFSWVNTDLKSKEPRCYIIRAYDQQDQPINTPLNVGPYFNVANDGSVCIDYALGSPPFEVSIPNEPPVMVPVDPNDDLSVCAENNRPWYQGYPHGKCKEIKLYIDTNPVCVPGSTWDCSDEKPSDPALDGHGICKSATKLCADGTGWSTCKDPVLPKPETCGCPNPPDPNMPCDPELGLDEDCDGDVNEVENGNNCACTPGETMSCYVGNPEDLAVPKTACDQGLQKCTQFGEFGKCTTDQDGILPDAVMVTPDLATEDCDPMDGVESCTAKPCDFAPLWWHTFGKLGKHVNLANHLEANFMTAITHVTNDGDTASHGSCFAGINQLNKYPFNGVTLAKYQVNGPDPDFQYCDEQAANIIEGKLDPGAIRADSGANGTAISGLTSGAVAPNLNGGLNGCDKGIPAGASFVTRFNSKNACQYRVAATGTITIKDVSVGNSAATTMIGLTIPLNQGVALTVAGVPLANCTFAAGPARSYYVKLELDMLGNVACTPSAAYTAETPLALDVDSTGVTSIVYRQADSFRLRQLDGTLALTWPVDPIDVNGTAIASELTVPGSDFEPTDISSFGQRIAVTGNFIGSMNSYGSALVADTNNRDFVLLVADNGQPTRGVTLVGQASPQKMDLGDFGTAVKWVRYFDPETYVESEGIVVAGNSYSEDFVFGACWTDVNLFHDPSAVDGFVGVFKYTSGLPLDGSSCGDHHVLTGLDNQAINALSVSDMRLGLCGYHTDDINLAGEIVEKYTGTDKNAHCGYAVLPIKNLQ